MPLSAPVPTARVGEVPRTKSIHPLHAFLLGGATSFFVTGFLSDWAYYSSHEIQWKNFADWLIMGGLVLGGFALLWAMIDLLRSSSDRRQRAIYPILLLAVGILGFINELVHAKDAWASMPEALLVSAVLAVLATLTAWLGFSTLRTGAL